MRDQEIKSRRQAVARAFRPAIALGVAFALQAPSALAQRPDSDAELQLRTNYLGYAASVSPRFTYSDNINLQRGALADDEYIFS
ncbi:MAG: hypothetical protein ACX939_06520, partial [Hyphococcus sp.]